MNRPGRESIITALLQKVSFDSFETVGRRLIPWTEVAAQPALFIRQVSDRLEHNGMLLPALTMSLELWIYCHEGDPKASAATKLNDLVDSVEDALKPDDITKRLFTIGGLVQMCWIDGEIEYDPGDLDNQAIAKIPVKIIVP
jgi:hypothetical protein